MLSDPLGETVECGFRIPRGQAMKDTTDAMERKYRDRLLKRSGEERIARLIKEGSLSPFLRAGFR